MTKKKQVNRKERETKIGREKQKINDQQKKKKTAENMFTFKKNVLLYMCDMGEIWLSIT